MCYFLILPLGPKKQTNKTHGNPYEIKHHSQIPQSKSRKTKSKSKDTTKITKNKKKQQIKLKLMQRNRYLENSFGMGIRKGELIAM